LLCISRQKNVILNGREAGVRDHTMASAEYVEGPFVSGDQEILPNCTGAICGRKVPRAGFAAAQNDILSSE
jgi:hypothetical protein